VWTLPRAKISNGGEKKKEEAGGGLCHAERVAEKKVEMAGWALPRRGSERRRMCGCGGVVTPPRGRRAGRGMRVPEEVDGRQKRVRRVVTQRPR
jgi:hypothetical protein